MKKYVAASGRAMYEELVMIIKKFTAKTEKEAIEAAKKELGENVVIMNVKNTRKKGFLGIFSSSVVEVTVALEAENDKISQMFPPKKETNGPLVPDSVWEKKTTTPKVERAVSTSKSMISDDETGKAIVEKLDGLQLLLQQQLLKAEEELQGQ